MVKASRWIVLAVALVALVAASCSSSKKQDASVSAAGSGAAKTGFCQGFDAVGTLVATSSGTSLADLAAKLKGAARKIRSNAPADVADSARAHADLLDQAVDGVAGANSKDAVAGVEAASGEAIVPVVAYAASNCTGS